ncbi:MAG: hypothetical protein JWN57_2291, partial [Frankiales bacterium]|nr:hypothetical protein [Frankiales bacterium]
MTEPTEPTTPTPPAATSAPRQQAIDPQVAAEATAPVAAPEGL